MLRGFFEMLVAGILVAVVAFSYTFGVLYAENLVNGLGCCESTCTLEGDINE